MTLRQVHMPGGAGGPVGRGGHSTLLPALTVENRTQGVLAVPEQQPQAELVRIRYDLTGRPVSTLATSTGWQNPGNAAGPPNGSLASITGGLSSISGSLTLDFADPVGKDSLTVTDARLLFYGRLRGVILANAFLRYERSINGVNTQLIAFTENVDHLTTPYVAPLGTPTWAELATVRATVAGQTNAASAGAVVELDAVELVVTAFREDTL